MIWEKNKNWTSKGNFFLVFWKRFTPNIIDFAPRRDIFMIFVKGGGELFLRKCTSVIIIIIIGQPVV